MEPQLDAPGWYLVHGRLSASQLEYIAEGNLTHGSGDHAIAFDVLEVAVDDEQVRVRVSETAPREALALYVRNTGRRQVLEGLGKGLQASRENPLLTQFGEQRLTPIQHESGLTEVHGWPALRPAQQDAGRGVLLARAPISVGTAGNREDGGGSAPGHRRGPRFWRSLSPDERYRAARREPVPGRRI